jgi:hypothetical protein
VLILLCTLGIITVAFIQTGVFSFVRQRVDHIQKVQKEYLPSNIDKIELTYRPWDETRPPPIKKTITDSELISRIVEWINSLPEPPKVQNGYADFGQGADMLCTTEDGKTIKITLEVAHRDIIVEENQNKFVRFDQFNQLWKIISNEVGVKTK